LEPRKNRFFLGAVSRGRGTHFEKSDEIGETSYFLPAGNANRKSLSEFLAEKQMLPIRSMKGPLLEEVGLMARNKKPEGIRTEHSIWNPGLHVDISRKYAP